MSINIFFITISSAIFLSFTAFAAPNFPVPQWCTEEVTGAPSDDLATGGDAPVVQVSYSPRGDTYKDIDEVIVSNLDSNDWYVRFIAPSSTFYTIMTVYTPFLITYQSVSLSKGDNKWVLLSRPGTYGFFNYSSFTIDAGSKYPNSFIEFYPPYQGADPFTMQVGSDGKITIGCVQKSLFVGGVTLYDSNHVFVGTGFFYYDGTITLHGQ